MTMVMAWLRVIVVTVILIPFIYWATRFWAQRATGSRGGGHLVLLESLALTQDSRLSIVRIAGKVCVVGVSPKGVQVLGEITDTEVLEELSRTGFGPGGQGVAGGLLPDGAKSLTEAGAKGILRLGEAFRKFVETGRVEVGERPDAVADEAGDGPEPARPLTAEGTSALKEQLDRLRRLEVTAEDEARVAQGQ